MAVDRVDDPTRPIEPDTSLPELLSRLSSDFGELVSTQVELAKVEIKEEIAQAGKGAGLLGGGAFVAYLAVILLSFAAAWGLAEIMPEGFAFLIVGAVYAVVAIVLLRTGREQMRSVQAVPETTETLKEDVQWAKRQMS
jgi:uncharacterized membrane protein YqjE